MWNRITEFVNNKLSEMIPYTIILFIVYLLVSSWVFAFRHPWATDMERFIHIGDALTFKKISYKEMRGDYEK